MQNLIFEKDFKTYVDDNIITEIPVTIGENVFYIYVTDKESEREYKKYNLIGEDQYNTIDSIIALKKLTKLLELSMDVVTPLEK